ncbi:unnamed protein product [Alternaria alternata]
MYGNIIYCDMFFQASLLLTTFFSSASAQYALNNSVGSCGDVHCPPDNTPVGAECNVTDKIYEAIGLRSFSTAITDDNNNLTWTLATHHNQTHSSKTMLTEKSFYLGTPPSLELDSENLPYRGCAIFLYENPVGRNNSWDCEKVVGATCISSLLTQVNTLLGLSANETETTEESCLRVQRGLNETFPDECSEVTNSTSWPGISAIPLTGKDAPTPPDSTSNASSNCHPTLPKSNDLSYAFGYNASGLGAGTDIVITTFWSPDGNVEGAVSGTDSQLMCLWINPLTDRSVATNVGNGEDDEGAAIRPSFSMVSVLICMGLGLFQFM